MTIYFIGGSEVAGDYLAACNNDAERLKAGLVKLPKEWANLYSLPPTTLLAACIRSAISDMQGIYPTKKNRKKKKPKVRR